MNWETLLSIGDSITIGARSYAGYPEYTGAMLEKKIGNKWMVINHAVSGYTAMDIQRHVTHSFSNLKQFAPGIVTILAGTNDVKLNTDPEDFRIAYSQLVLKAMMLSVNKNVVLIRIPSFPRNVSYPYNYQMNARVEVLNNIIAEIAKDHWLRVMQLDIAEGDLCDGVHLSPQGSKHAGEQLADFIMADKGSQSIPVIKPSWLSVNV
jgi:lysophospholipase L1-like esterase